MGDRSHAVQGAEKRRGVAQRSSVLRHTRRWEGLRLYGTEIRFEGAGLGEDWAVGCVAQPRQGWRWLTVDLRVTAQVIGRMGASCNKSPPTSPQLINP